MLYLPSYLLIGYKPGCLSNSKSLTRHRGTRAGPVKIPERADTLEIEVRSCHYLNLRDVNELIALRLRIIICRFNSGGVNRVIVIFAVLAIYYSSRIDLERFNKT